MSQMNNHNTNAFYQYLHVHLNANDDCWWIARYESDGRMYLTKRADYAHAFTLRELREANAYIQTFAKQVQSIEVVNCYMIDVLTPDQRKLLRLPA